MPTISIRQHGVSASRNQTVVNPVTGEIVKLTAFNQPERTATPANRFRLYRGRSGVRDVDHAVGADV